MKKKTESSVHIANLTDAPRPGLPDDRKLRRRHRRFTVVVWASVLLLPFACLGLIVSVAGNETPAISQGGATTSPGRAAATSAVIDWLSSRPAPLPGGQLLGWESSTPNGTVTPGANDKGPTVRLRTERFTVVADGVIYNADVQVAIDSRGGVEVLTTPSLIPVAPPVADDWATELLWPGLQSSTTVPEAVDRTVSLWAEAYGSGDPDQLRLAVGDRSSDHTYVPLVGTTQVTAKVTALAPLDEENLSVAVVRCELTVTWPADEDDEDRDDEDDPPPSVTFDLLVHEADTAAPVVVAWGSPGTGPDLTPYVNAVDGDRGMSPTSTSTSTTTSS